MNISIFPGNVKSYFKNSVFESNKKDDWNSIFIQLKKYLKSKKIDINTFDIPTKTPPTKYIYFDLPYVWTLWSLPAWKKIFLNSKKNILICQEPPTVIPYNYLKLIHYLFTKVYTWNDDLVDNKKYFKLTIPKLSDGMNTKENMFKKKRFLTLINTNKSSFYPFELISPFGKELYSERIKAINFFETTIPKKFFLYGRGWNKPQKYSFTEKILGFKKYSTYKGEVTDKIKVLSQFKYCLCFENLTNVNGYITEKIFDCFKAKCIPIYWGASNIEKYIPKNCFIDFRKFNDYKKLLTFLESIDEKKYNEYIINIKKLLKNKKFTSVWFEEGYCNFIKNDVLEIKK